MVNSRIARVLGIRRSSASGKHADRRTRRQKTRQAQKASAVKDQS